MKIEHVVAAAMAAYEANRAYCIATGDDSQKPWNEAEQWQRDSALRGVQYVVGGSTPKQQHEAWMRDKLAAGWVYGPAKDATAKTHPCLVPHEELPPEQQRKDGLYIAVVRGMLDALKEQP